MKKIISLGVASAICALTAISASAAANSTWGDVKGEIVKDGVITIDILAKSDIKTFTFDGIDAKGLEVQQVTTTSTAMIKDFKNGKFILTGGTDAVTVKAGEVICTISAKVTGEAGSEISLGLTDSSAVSTADLPDSVWKETVKGATESKPDDSKPAEGDSKPAEGDSKPAEGDSKPAEGDSKPGEEKPGTNPGTGVALAVVPAVLAAAGVVVAKKRK